VIEHEAEYETNTQADVGQVVQQLTEVEGEEQAEVFSEILNELEPGTIALALESLPLDERYERWQQVEFRAYRQLGKVPVGRWTKPKRTLATSWATKGFLSEAVNRFWVIPRKANSSASATDAYVPSIVPSSPKRYDQPSTDFGSQRTNPTARASGIPIGRKRR
jgi:hypothetical protein